MMETVHNVLAVPELLSAIFGNLDKRTQARCAVVCKNWSSLALDCLWSSLDSVVPLLRILGELTTITEYSGIKRKRLLRVSYVENPAQEQWIRFNLYSIRVKTVSVSSSSRYTGLSVPGGEVINFSLDLFAQLAIRCRLLSVTPNLTRLVVDASKDITLLFKSTIFLRYLETLEVAIDTSSWPAGKIGYVRNFFEDVAALAPSLRELDLDGLYLNGLFPHFEDVAPFSKIMTEFFSILEHSLCCLRSLGTIKLSAKFVSPPVVAALSRLPSLHSFHVIGKPDFIQLDHMYNCCFLSEGFRDLRTLQVPVLSMRHAESLWYNGFGRLTTLFLYCATEIPLSTMEKLIGGIPDNCPNLNNLTLFADRGYPLSIAPLLVMHNLRELTTWPLDASCMTDNDLEECLTWNTSSLECLRVSWLCDPKRSLFTLHSLATLARLFPKLRSLSICINIDSTPDITIGLKAKTQVLFRHLEYLNFGLTGIRESNIASTAVFLSEMFSMEAESTLPAFYAFHGLPPNVGTDPSEGMLCDLQQCSRRWSDVRRIVKAFKEASDVKARQIRHLEEELAEARERICSMERIGMSSGSDL